MSNNFFLNFTPNFKRPDLTLRHDTMRSVVDRTLVIKARANNAAALRQIGLTALRYSRIGFAQASFKLAVKAGYLESQISLVCKIYRQILV